MKKLILIATLTMASTAFAGHHGEMSSEMKSDMNEHKSTMDQHKDKMNDQKDKMSDHKDPFSKMDLDENGKLSKQEAKGPIKDHFDKLDVNEDGFVSRDELPMKKMKDKKGY